MKAFVLENYGDANELKQSEIAKPQLNATDVLVAVHAVSVNPMDWKIRAGYAKEFMPFSFPIVFGWDVAGVMIEVGEQVKGFKVGDEVLAKADMSKPGGFAEFIAIDEKLLVKKPGNVTFEEAAALPLASVTAWQSLVDHAKLKEGETILIHGGAGGVGGFAIQFAKLLGATVSTTTSGKNIELVREMGADTVINYEKQSFVDELSNVDVVLDTVGDDVLTNSYGVLKPGGRLVTVAGFSVDEELAKEKGITASVVMSLPNTEQLANIANLVSEGKVKVVFAGMFPFTEEGIRDAHRLSESGHANGKVIVKVK